MILDDLFEASLPPNIKPSDLPPGRRQPLTMRDIEAERPKGAFRYQVGDKRFMDLKAAREFAAGTGERVRPIAERADSSSRSARLDRILKQLRAKHPQAEDDLEALIYDFRSQQNQDRRDISNLYSENDTEEEKIERLEKALELLRRRREIPEYGTKKKPDAVSDTVGESNKDACYHKVKSRYKVWPSAYASGALVQCRKKGAANWGKGSDEK
jgi:hypothetical protein